MDLQTSELARSTGGFFQPNFLHISCHVLIRFSRRVNDPGAAGKTAGISGSNILAPNVSGQSGTEFHVGFRAG